MGTFFFLPVESTRRELDYKLNLSRLLCKAGFTVLLGNPPFIRDELKYKNYRGVFLEKGINPTPEYYESLNAKGILVYDHSEEGMSKPIYSLTFPPAVATLHLMKRIFLWGEKQKQELMELLPDQILADKYFIIGSPAFDLSSAKYRAFNIALKPKSLPANYILVNTNFGSLNSHDLEQQLESCSVISPASHQMMIESYEKEVKQFAVFSDWLQKIITRFPDETFLIRPHPTEILENYEKHFGKYPNVIISKEGNVNNVISAAKLVLHKDCTTALQSYLMGVPVISLGGPSINSTYEQWSLAFGTKPDTVEHAIAMITELLQDKQWPFEVQNDINEQAKKVVGENFSSVGNVCKNLVNTIVADAQDILQDTNEYKIKDSRTLLQKLKLYLRKFLPLHYKVPAAARETMQKIDLAEVNIKLKVLEATDPLNLNYKVKQVFPNAFIISGEAKHI